MEKLIYAIKNANREDFLMATASGLTALFMLVDIPVWAVFIGWTWYLSIGANVRAIKEGTITCILGGVLALSSVVCIDLLKPYLPWLLPNIIGGSEETTTGVHRLRGLAKEGKLEDIGARYHPRYRLPKE